MIIFASSQRRTPAAGFTLLELLIALVIMIAIIGIAWPSVGRYLSEQPIKNSTEVVRRQLAGSRHKAMTTGLLYQFRYEPGGQNFVVLPYELDAQQVSSSGNNTTVTTGSVTNSSTLPVVSGQLDDTQHFASSSDAKAMFASSQLATSSSTERIPEELLALLSNGSQLSGVSWSPAILFYPDGTSDDSALSIMDDESRSMTLTLRGLTATVTVGQLQRGGRK